MSDWLNYYSKYKLILFLLALACTIIILSYTIHYGTGISQDSVSYIGTARNIIAGEGVIDCNGTPFISQPPLYPAVLALIGKIIGTDPLFFVGSVNAFLFGLIVYLGGLLTFKYMSSYPAFNLMGALAIVFSFPVFYVSIWAWSEPLFICFMLLSLLFAKSYLDNNDTISLILFSSSVALLCLTRYIGVSLVLSGALTILISKRDGPKNRITHLSIFTIISALPLGVWLIRNYNISGMLFGPRASSAYTLTQNLILIFNRLVYWYIPVQIAEHGPIMIIVSAGAGLFVGLILKNNWNNVKVVLRTSSPIILFVIIYTALLTIASTTTAIDPIDDRLLSPIYVPLTLLLLIIAQALFEPYRRHFSKKLVNSFMIFGLAIWLIWSIHRTIIFAVNSQNEKGYGSKEWKTSETIKYLMKPQTLKPKCVIYTNAPNAVYILANISAKCSPAKTAYNSPVIVNFISSLRSSWPQEKNVYLVWFDNVMEKYLFTVEELKTAANVQQIIRFKDGVVYSVTRKW